MTTLAAWCYGVISGFGNSPRIDIPTREGVMTATVGDWIVKGAVGEFYPCKPDAFAATFEPERPTDVFLANFDKDPATGRLYFRG